jgi:hypothetical protein
MGISAQQIAKSVKFQHAGTGMGKRLRRHRNSMLQEVAVGALLESVV